MRGNGVSASLSAPLLQFVCWLPHCTALPPVGFYCEESYSHWRRLAQIGLQSLMTHSVRMVYFCYPAPVPGQLQLHGRVQSHSPRNHVERCTRLSRESLCGSDWLGRRHPVPSTSSTRLLFVWGCSVLAKLSAIMHLVLTTQEQTCWVRLETCINITQLYNFTTTVTSSSSTTAFSSTATCIRVNRN